MRVGIRDSGFGIRDSLKQKSMPAQTAIHPNNLPPDPAA
jgi:hypothetical protein